jgi:GntR family transcriptional regulator
LYALLVALTSNPAIDRAAPLPLWAQVLADLRNRLQAGEFQQRFPTDEQLVGEYDVSRQTVREAVRRLADEGLLERTRGRGTRVRASFEQTAGTLESLYEQVREQGATQRSVVHAAEVVADPAIARRLSLPEDAPLVYIERLRLADEDPLALDRAWLPAKIARPLLRSDLTRTGLYVELARTCGAEGLYASERIRPVVPRPEDRRTLKLPRGEAAFSIERLTKARDDMPVEWRWSLVRGDRYTIKIELSAARRGGPGLPWASNLAGGA